MKKNCALCTVHCAYLGQRGQQPLGVVQGGPAVGQTVGHVSQLLPDWRQSDLDVAQAGPVQLGPALQLTQHRQGLAVQLLQDSGRAPRVWWREDKIPNGDARGVRSHR